MSTRTVRVLVENKETKELHWYASFEADDEELDLAVIPHQRDGTEVRVVTSNGDKIFTTFSAFVSMIDLAVELYDTYMESRDGSSFARWNTLDAAERQCWIEVAKRVTALGPIFNGVTAEKPRTFLDEQFDSSTLD